MNEDKLREYIRANKEPIDTCSELSKYFIGRHTLKPVYLTPKFEMEFNSKMCELEKLKEQLEASEKARKEAIEFINNINDWEVCSKYDCMYKDDVLDVLRVLDIDKGE